MVSAYPETDVFGEREDFQGKLRCHVCLQDRLQQGRCSRAYMDVLAACPGGRHDIGVPPKVDKTLVLQASTHAVAPINDRLIPIYLHAKEFPNRHELIQFRPVLPLPWRVRCGISPTLLPAYIGIHAGLHNRLRLLASAPSSLLCGFRFPARFIPSNTITTVGAFVSYGADFDFDRFLWRAGRHQR